MKGFFYGPRQVFRVFYEVAVFCAWPGYADDIGFLKGVIADKGGIYLAGEDNEWYRVHVSSGDAGYGICRPRARCYQ